MSAPTITSSTPETRGCWIALAVSGQFHSPKAREAKSGNSASPAPAGAGHAGEEALRIGRLRRRAGERHGRRVAEGRVEAGEPQRRAHGEEEAGCEAQAPRVVQAPEIQHQRRGDAEGKEVGQTVELGAEARGALQQPRQAAVDAVDGAGGHDQHRRVLPSSLEGEAHGGEAGAKAEHGEDVRDQAVEGRAARAGARARPPQALETLAQQPGARRPVVVGAGAFHQFGVAGVCGAGARPGTSSAITVSPPIMVWPSATRGRTPSGR